MRSLPGSGGQLDTLLLDADIERRLLGRIGGAGGARQLLLDAGEALALASAVRRELARNLLADRHPVLVCESLLRAPLSRLLRRFDRRIRVLSFTELSREAAVAPAGRPVELPPGALHA